MSIQNSPNFSFSMTKSRLKLIGTVCTSLQLLAMYLRSVYGEFLLYELRAYADQPGISSWFDSYAMAIHRAERATEFQQQLLIMDSFYLEFLKEAFDEHWLRKILARLQQKGNEVVLAMFERESGDTHYIYPTLVEATTVKFDPKTSHHIDDDFSEEELRRLDNGLKHRASNAYFSGKLFKGKPLAFETRSMFDRASQRPMRPLEQRSRVSRLLNWLMPKKRRLA